MALKLRWSIRAAASFEHIERYLNKEWGEHSAKRFTTKLYKTSQLLKRHPYLGLLQDQSGLRAIVISEQIILFYRISKQAITLVNLFDTRQHPDKMG